MRRRDLISRDEDQSVGSWGSGVGVEGEEQEMYPRGVLALEEEEKRGSRLETKQPMEWAVRTGLNFRIVKGTVPVK